MNPALYQINRTDWIPVGAKVASSEDADAVGVAELQSWNTQHPLRGSQTKKDENDTQSG